jgi:dethiobiotin synthetase
MRDDYFITGTDTNVGKTVLCALLVAALDGVYWKPIQTGASEGMDRQTVMRLAEVPEARTLPECYCFDLPVSPHLAAEASGICIDLARIERPARPTPNDPLIVEGAGGIAVPVNDSHSMLDVVRKLNMPVLVASRSSLGTINHTVLTVNALRTAGAEVRGVVMIGKKNKDNERAIERFANTPVLGRIPPLTSIDRDILLETFYSNFEPKYFQS